MITIKNLNKYYGYEQVLFDVNLSLPATGLFAITGPSGCGKSTLLHIMGGIDHDYLGEVAIDTYTIAYMFQQSHLISWLSKYDNARLHGFFAKCDDMEMPMLASLPDVRVTRMSIGQRQRIALERSFYGSPEVLLCDEPTASLDPANAAWVMERLKAYSEDHLVVFVSHDDKLIAAYADAVLTMQDGVLVSEKKKLVSLVTHRAKRSQKSIIPLTLRMMRATRRQFIAMILAITISLLCIMITFMAATSLKTMIYDYLDALIPAQSISFKMAPVDLDGKATFSHLSTIDHTFYYIDDCDILGLSFKKSYDASQVLFISDETGTAKNMLYGRHLQSDDEIVLPLSTAKTLSQDGDVEKLLNRTIYIYYDYHKKVKSCGVKIVGISSQTPAYTAFYQRESAHILHVKTLFQESLTSSLGIVYYASDARQALSQLREKAPSYRFKVVGATTRQKVVGTMTQVEMILMIFSALALISCIFLTGETMYLHVVKMKHDLAVMRCFGATCTQLVKTVLFQGIGLHVISFGTALSLFVGGVVFLNQVVLNELLTASVTLTYDVTFLCILALMSLIIILFSCLFAAFSVIRLDVVKALQ